MYESKCVIHTLNNFDVEEIEWKKAQIKNLSTKP